MKNSLPSAALFSRSLLRSALTTNSSSQTQAGIERLYQKHWTGLCRSLRKVYGEGPPDAEDLAQEAFTKYMRMADTSHIEEPRAFLLKIAINLGLKSLQRQSRSQDYVNKLIEYEREQVEERCPERVVAARQKIKSVEKNMRKLSKKQRELILRSRIKGQTYAQISEATGWSAADISRQLKAALAVLETQ
ncbi:RNA polymerase sigma factor [Agaribacterium haliotis]|uniref:RNA polymerase sigma factor n=1 Tax=Agaribacterium haliotis TaxID=2013869 RepID=UPI000BB58331|nr:sigma-70 family RNA polymerase sigma factor [Agaribacterium haliotis]